ncbi:MAG: thioredoxin family protein [Acidobacteria bacterium]|nr:thioredoxin family protein [Acidobacteriota bacterium]
MRVIAITLLGCSLTFAQKLNPVKWTLAFEPGTAAPGGTVLGRLTGRMDGEWHMYSLSTPKGPIATTITLAENPNIAALRIYQPQPERKFDPNFGVETETFGKEVTFLLEIALAANAPSGPLALTAQPRYQACTDKQCLPPRTVPVAGTLLIDPSAQASTPAIPAGYTEFDPSKPAAAAPARANAAAPAAGGAAPFLLLAFGFGLAAIFTPCVFPMIPITLSFFLNREGVTRGQTIQQAAIFSLGIIVLFTGIGTAVTAALGPFGVVQLGSNPWVNGFIALVFLGFGLSLLGAFEITLPSGLLTRVNQASQRSGLLGTLLMGLTFALTSFACVGPFMGTLLAASVQGGGWKPTLGMLTFATGLASPFFLLALFPAYLKRLPRSGGWLARVKVVLGFIVLAAMLKYASSIDQVLQWNLLTRERFVAAWFVLFAMPGLYLLGMLRLEGVEAGQKLGVTRLLVASVFLIFAFSLLPGMFGARLGELDAYVPLAANTGGAGSGAAAEGWLKNQLPEALDRARQQNKRVLVSFTGYACTNCHWMKANMFPRPEIAAALKEIVLVELYTDGTDATSEENQKLQESQFGTVAIPYYAILDANQKVLATFPGLTRETSEFLKFLKTGA